MSQRPRSNTNSFGAFPWLRQRNEQVPNLVAQVQQPLDEVIKALTPPQVPSLSSARSLAVRLATESPLPVLSLLNPILFSLCGVESPVHIQSAGYDILSAYYENTEANVLPTTEKHAYLSLFLPPHSSIHWSPDLWESRFRALRALTKWGKDVVGVEVQFINILKSWIQSAFEGLLIAWDLDRERSIELLADFLFSVLESQDIMARIPDDELSGVLRFYGTLSDRCLNIPFNSSSPFDSSAAISSPLTDIPLSPTTSSRPTPTHRRHPSSLSIPSSSPAPASLPKRPVDIVLPIYLRHLCAQVKRLPQATLSDILPLLFRALAVYASPLPRLSVMARTHLMSQLEEHITNVLDDLFAGPYSTSCMVILKEYLSPPHPLPTSVETTIRISIGAHRTLRSYIRKRLSTRLARAYVSREISLGYSPSGAPGHMDVERELMESAWPKDDVSGWDAGRLGRVLSSSVNAWIECELIRDDVIRLAIEQILDEVAGILKDVFLELDAREDNQPLDEEEAGAVGEILHQLATYVPQIRYAFIPLPLHSIYSVQETTITRSLSSRSLSLGTHQRHSFAHSRTSYPAIMQRPLTPFFRIPFCSLQITSQMSTPPSFHSSCLVSMTCRLHHPTGWKIGVSSYSVTPPYSARHGHLHVGQF